jgi:hypothetical protein
MRSTLTLAVLLVIPASGLLPTGCAVDSASTSDSTTLGYQLLSDKPPRPDEPFGECLEQGGLGNFECTADGASGCHSFGVSTTCFEEPCGPSAQHWATCRHLCVTDDDCPVPVTGNAVSTCYQSPDGPGENACVLRCGGETSCPDGYTCVDPESTNVVAGMFAEPTCLLVYVSDS